MAHLLHPRLFPHNSTGNRLTVGFYFIAAPASCQALFRLKVDFFVSAQAKISACPRGMGRRCKRIFCRRAPRAHLSARGAHD